MADVALGSRSFAATAVVALLVGAAAIPMLDRPLARARLGPFTHGAVDHPGGFAPGAAAGALRFSGPLASWQTIGGCGAGAATGSGIGIKWIGRGATGGSFNVQTQGNFSRIPTQGLAEDHYAVNTLIFKDFGAWTLGLNLPYVYKYLNTPFDPDTDLSNGGPGDVSLLIGRKLGPIGATQLTLSLGLPTAKFDERYKMKLLRQHQQLGFGRVTGSLVVDHTLDEIWGLAVLGGAASYRGGENSVYNYRAPSASTYAFVGYFLGPFVPAVGLSATGFHGHDRDQTEDENTGLFAAALNLSLEWSADWIAVLLGASVPYAYDGITKDENGFARSPWGFAPWTVALGIWIAP